MPALYIFELTLGAVFLYAVYTQVLVPLWRDTPLFPWLETERKLEGKLKEAEQHVVEAELEREIHDIHLKEEEIRKEIV